MGKVKPTMDWDAIKAEVHRRGMTLTELASRSGLHPSILRKVKSMTHYAGQDALASFIDQKPEDLWPDRYPKKTSSIFDSKKWGDGETKKNPSTSDKAAA